MVQLFPAGTRNADTAAETAAANDCSCRSVREIERIRPTQIDARRCPVCASVRTGRPVMPPARPGDEGKRRCCIEIPHRCRRRLLQALAASVPIVRQERNHVSAGRAWHQQRRTEFLPSLLGSEQTLAPYRPRILLVVSVIL